MRDEKEKWLSPYTNRRWLKVNHKHIDNDIENYEVLAVFRKNYFANPPNVDKDKIVFVDEKQETFLDFECMDTDDELVCKIIIPFVSADEDTVFYMYWTVGNDA